MGVTEIVLIIVGGIVLVLSYVLPAGKKEGTAEAVPVPDKGMIKDLIEKEISDARNHINDVVDETITYSMEKTERTMERLTNEKIMAVSEYSDQVLENINKNHQEVMFLYDMLNDKHENLVNTVSEASKRAQEIKQTVQDAEPVERQAEPETEFVPIAPKKVEIAGGVIQDTDKGGDGAEQAGGSKEKPRKTTAGKTAAGRKKAAKAEPEPDSRPAAEEQQPEEKVCNNNEKILRLHKLGKSETAIAKELGLGIGEVKLVIDLFEQA